MSDMEKDLNDAVAKISGAYQAIDMMSEMIWGAAVTTTRAFGKVELKIDSNNNRVFVAIHVRWPFNHPKFKLLRDAWLSRAERNCKKQLPDGWKLLCYYAKGEK